MSSSTKSGLVRYQGDLGEVLRAPEPPDPVFQTTKGWFFNDECWVEVYGPFPTEKRARAGLRKYNEEMT